MTEVTSELVLPFALNAFLLIILGTVIGLSRFWFVGTKQHTYETLTPGLPQGPRWYSSLNRAYINGIEAFALFAPALLLSLQIGGESLAIMPRLAWVFVAARTLYSFLYLVGGYKLWISFVWLISFGATIAAWALLVM